jgi:peroxisomal membrane protein 4
MSMPTSLLLLDELTAVVSALIGGAKYGVKIRLPHALVMTFLFRKDLSATQKIRTILKLVVEHASNLAAFATIYKCVLAFMKGSSRYIGLRHQGVGWRERNNKSKNSSSSRGIIQSLGRILISLVVDGPFFSVNSNTNSKTYPIKAGQPERPYHSLLAGAAGGYIVWGRYSSVNHQIVLYLTSRILVGLAKRGWEHVYERPGHFSDSNKNSNSNSNDSILQHPRTYPFVAATVWGIVMFLFEESPHVLHRSLKKSMDDIYRRP